MLANVIDFPKGDDEAEFRVYCSLSMAAIALDVLFQMLDRERRSVPDDGDFYINDGKDGEDARYLWTAAMILGSTGRSGFKAKHIGVVSSLEYGKQFNPETETSILFGKFSRNSLYNRVFKPILGEYKPTCRRDEIKQPIASQVPERGNLRNRVLWFVSLSIIRTFFDCKFDIKTFRFKGYGISGEQVISEIHGLGYVKLAQAISTFFSSGAAETLGLSQMRIGDFGKEGCLQIIKACEQVINLDLCANALNQFNIQDLCDILSSLSPKTTHLELTYNELHQFDESELQQLVESIPSTVTHIDFSDNGLSNDLIARLMAHRKQHFSASPRLSQRFPEPSAPLEDEFEPGAAASSGRARARYEEPLSPAAAQLQASRAKAASSPYFHKPASGKKENAGQYVDSKKFTGI